MVSQKEKKVLRLRGALKGRRKPRRILKKKDTTPSNFVKKTKKKQKEKIDLKQVKTKKGIENQSRKDKKHAKNISSRFNKLRNARIKREHLRASAFATSIREYIHSNILCYGLIEVLDLGGAYSSHLGTNYRTVKVREMFDLEKKPVVKNQERVLLFIVIESWHNGNKQEMQINQSATKVITSVAQLENCNHPEGYFKFIRRDDFEQIKNLVARIKKRVAKRAEIEKNVELIKTNEEMFN